MNVQPIVISELEIISENDKKNIVGTITSINSETLESIKPMGTQEILEYVPGINGFSDDGIGNSRINIGIRGINPRRSSRVLVLEDGIPIQPAIYVYPNMYYNPPVERISKVEVVKGSASILYGPQTMGGVVNYLTKNLLIIIGLKSKLLVEKMDILVPFMKREHLIVLNLNLKFSYYLKEEMDIGIIIVSISIM
tara:strand:- start:263 stop:847 length:585 start_codon:yes stop_codon:yes gene_type:complete